MTVKLREGSLTALEQVRHGGNRLPDDHPRVQLQRGPQPGQGQETLHQTQRWLRHTAEADCAEILPLCLQRSKKIRKKSLTFHEHSNAYNISNVDT